MNARRARTWSTVACSFMLGAAASIGSAQSIVVLPMFSPYEPHVTAMSGGGNAIGITHCCNVHGGPIGTIWNQDSGSGSFGPVGSDWDYNIAAGFSADGSVVLGTHVNGVGGYSYAFLAPSTDLGTFPGGVAGRCVARGISGDGTVVVADCSSSTATYACRWTAATGMMSLGTLPGGVSSHASAISLDGQTIVGYSDSASGQFAFRWTAGTGMVSIGAPDGAPSSKALAVNADGAVIVGSYPNPGHVGTLPFRWTEQTGAQPLGAIGNPDRNINLVALNAAGTVAVGHTHQDNAIPDFGIAWTLDQGLMPIGTYLAPLGGTGVGYLAAGGLSSDGRHIAGDGADATGRFVIWIATLPPRCGSADFNCDGDTGTDADIESFFACIAGNCPAAPCQSNADFNSDGDVGTDADIEAFFRVLAGGVC